MNPIYSCSAAGVSCYLRGKSTIGILIRQLKDQGVEVFHTHSCNGIGMASEMPEMLKSKQAAGIARRYGMKVDHLGQ